MKCSQGNYIIPSNKIITSNRRKIYDHSFFTWSFLLQCWNCSLLLSFLLGHSHYRVIINDSLVMTYQFDSESFKIIVFEFVGCGNWMINLNQPITDHNSCSLEFTFFESKVLINRESRFRTPIERVHRFSQVSLKHNRFITEKP